MKRVAESPEVSRWRLAERLGGTPPVRTPRYRKEQDEELLHHIRAFRMNARPVVTGGSAAAQYASEVRRCPSVNHKLVYRIMYFYEFGSKASRAASPMNTNSISKPPSTANADSPIHGA